MIRIDDHISPSQLLPALQSFWQLSAQKIELLDRKWSPEAGAPVFTIEGRYTSRGWTEWTQGFQFGAALLQYDATNEERFLTLGREQTLQYMAPHISHTGVHDHGFNNVSTYGNLLRLWKEGRAGDNEWLGHFCELALKLSGAVQASRWSPIPDGGYIYSFNGPHSLFVDTIRSLRALALSHQLGHVLQAENDKRHSLLERLLQHAQATARYSIYYGEQRDNYDLRGRTVHEAIFNRNDGAFRCPSSQQGYSPFSTWTRGLAWAMLGFAEEIEWLQSLEETPEIAAALEVMNRAAEATCEFYIAQTPSDGIPYWDTGAPGLAKMGDYLDRPAEPFNDHEPVDSSAAAIAAQGLLRLGRLSGNRDFLHAGLTVARTLFSEPYLSTDAQHEGLLLHSVYHRPNGWDHIPANRKVPCGEACMWGDYHLRELALTIQRPDYAFFRI
jgi:unsaturated chondroitin disaccharide hydrolase